MPPVKVELPRANLLGVGVHATSLQAAIEVSDTILRSGQKGYVCLTGVHGLMEAHRSSAMQRILNKASLCLPDGMPTVWMGRAQGHRSMARVYGPDYMLAMCRYGVPRGYRHFLFGGKLGVAGQLRRRLEQTIPGIEIAGTFTPSFGPFDAAQEEALRVRLRESKPHILWVGLSTPKQERFMAAYLDRFDVPLMAGVGAAFDIHAGLLKDAPEWMKACGLQWLDRLRKEPRRLWKRYLTNNSRFLLALSLQVIGAREYPIDT